MATLCRFSAQVIVAAVERCFERDKTPSIFISGGGMHNPLLLRQLKEKLSNASFHSTDDLEINPDAKEAVLFAILANETLVGEDVDFGSREGVPSVRMGKICLP
ncbi:anhydro-N-acetylmuramic acid kinase [compost metagenome]